MRRSRVIDPLEGTTWGSSLMRWPWQKPEVRTSQPFSDAVISALISAADGTTAGDPSQIAALETAAGLYAACFQAATINHPALTPAVRGLIARDLIRRGENVLQIKVDNGMLRLQPIGSWDVRGGPDEKNWFYRIDEFGPSGNLTHFVPSAGVVHTRYSIDNSRAWIGIPPLGWARAVGTLAANLETRLGEEAGAPVGQYLTYPHDQNAEDGADDDKLKELKANIRASKGRQIMVESVNAAAESRMSAPNSDFKPAEHRFGANPPATLPTLRTDAARAVLSACQVPAALFDERAPGTTVKEQYRRFAMGPLAGLAAIIETELSIKLETPVSFDFSGLWAHDIVGRSQAFQKLMMTDNMDVNKALNISGLMAMETE